MNYKSFPELLIQALDELPAAPDEPYYSTVGSLAAMVANSEDPKAWQALLRLAKRVDVGTRMEFLNHMSYCCTKNTPLEPHINFVRQFLDDTSVRDVKSNPEMFNMLSAGSTFDKIAVRDFAALKLAYLLGLDVERDPTWTEADRQQLRQRVKAKLKEWDAQH